MSELRQDPVSGRWVIIAHERDNRPDEFVAAPVQRIAAKCPFCIGNEAETPEAVAVYGVKPSDWQVRVVPNKYPAVNCTPNGPLRQAPLGQSAVATGIHEVIIEAPRHVASLTELNQSELLLTWTAYRERLVEHARDQRWKYGQVFKNVGAAAGASIEHAHSQLIVLPHVPGEIQTELDSCERFCRDHGRPLFADLIARELAAGERMVAESPRFVAFCPFASRFPYEVWVLPRQQAARFYTCPMDDEEMGELGSFVQKILLRLEHVLNRPSYNFFLHTAPFDSLPYDYYHWHVEIFPRVTKAAGFEWGTGYFINPVSPEEAAAALRG
jgi:UDPglucose--hexose-1-phosphate uridylyltransferase